MANQILTALALAGSMAAWAAEPKPAIQINLVDSAKLSPKALARGKELASYTLAKAGIRIVWSESSSPDYWFEVKNTKPAVASAEALGFTIRDGETGVARAAIYYPMLQELAIEFQVEEGEVLGAAMAHEIGHLLGEGHAPRGVMTPKFSRQQIADASQGALNFGPEQSARMRAELLRRNGDQRNEAPLR